MRGIVYGAAAGWTCAPREQRARRVVLQQMSAATAFAATLIYVYYILKKKTSTKQKREFQKINDVYNIIRIVFVFIVR